MEDKTKGRKRAEFVICHANGRGTGSAIKFMMFPAQGDSEGFLTMRISPQKGNTSFYWNSGIEVTLGFQEITVLDQVMRGEIESVNDDRGFIFANDDGTHTVFKFKHVLEYVAGYQIDITRSACPNAIGGAAQGYTFLLKPNEALGLSMAMEQSLTYICFGIPKQL